MNTSIAIPSANVEETKSSEMVPNRNDEKCRIQAEMAILGVKIEQNMRDAQTQSQETIAVADMKYLLLLRSRQR